MDEYTNRIMRLPEVKRLTGLSRTTIYQMMITREFPQSLKLGHRAVGWRYSDLQEWLDQRVVNSAESNCKSSKENR